MRHLHGFPGNLNATPHDARLRIFRTRLIGSKFRRCKVEARQGAEPPVHSTIIRWIVRVLRYHANPCSNTAHRLRASDCLPERSCSPRGRNADRVFGLIEERIDVSRGDIFVTSITEPDSIFGEMSLFSDRPSAFTITARSAPRVHVLEDARRFFPSEPEAAFLIARLLAHRLTSATGYLVDLKQQFAAQGNHLAMVEEVLQSRICRQYEEFSPGSDRAPGP
jgi:CRP/FNR family cyclic AMP-dependent transcriptional regulator